MDAIEVAHLTKRYGQTLAVDDIGFTVPVGATLGLLGGNGAGKTTTIAMLLGLLIPTAGSIRVLGHDMAANRFAALARMNFSSPYIALPHRLTVLENLRVYGHLYDVKRLEHRIGELAGQLDLGDLLHRPAGQLSAGQKTRVALAKSLINRPELLLLDEPTASLDPDTGDVVRGWLERYRAESGCTVLLASHNMAEVERLCARRADAQARPHRRSRQSARFAAALRARRSGSGVPRHRPRPPPRRRPRTDEASTHDRLAAPHLGDDVSPSGAVSPLLAAAAGTRLLAGAANVHLGLHRIVPGIANGQFRRHRRRHAAGRRAAVGSRTAQPDGRRDQLPGGALVAQSGPRLRQPAAPLGTGGGTDRHVGHPHARRRYPRPSCWHGCCMPSTCSRSGRSWCCSSST